MAGILEGIKVIDMGHVAAVPAAGAMMADWGAEVIKVEPLTGERARGSRVTPDGFDWGIQGLNRGKKALSLDLKKDAGKDILYRLVKKADIFMSNYELSALKSLKMDYATLSQINQGIVYGVLTGYGTQGPDKDLRGFDYSAGWARSGIQYLIGEPGELPPPQRGGMIDLTTGTQIVAGLMAALLHKHMTGKGQEVQFSLYHSGVWTICGDIQQLLLGQEVTKFERRKAKNPLWNSFQAKDRWFMMTNHIPDVMWPDVCRAIERPDLINDPRFTTKEKQELNCEEMIRILDSVFITRNFSEWEKRFKENNVIFALIQTPQEVVADPQAVANNFFRETMHPKAGIIKFLATPVKFCQNPATIKTAAPDCGQHNDEILKDAGYSSDEIKRFRADGIIK